MSSLKKLREVFTSKEDSSIIDLAEGDVKSSISHYSLLVKAIDEAINDMFEDEAKTESEAQRALNHTFELYRAIYKVTKHASHKQYSSYYKRVLNIGICWLNALNNNKSFNNMTRTKFLKILPTLNEKAVINLKLHYYYVKLYNMVFNDKDRILSLKNLLKSNKYHSMMVLDGEDWMVQDTIQQLIKEFDKADATDADKATSKADATDADATDADKADERNLRMDYIIEKLSLLDIQQLDRVVSFLDTL